MKITVDKEELSRAVSIVSRLATTRSTLPILQNIYLKVNKKSVEVRSTDLEQTLQVEVDGRVEELGSLTIPARLFSEFLQNSTDQELTLESQDTTLHLISSNHMAKMKGMPAEEYPDIPEVKTTQSITLPTPILEEALVKTLFAVASDDTRPILSGLLFRFQGKKLTVVGTDGYRLALFSKSLESTAEGDFILPKRSMQELQRLLVPGEVTFQFANTQVHIVLDKVKFTTRVLDGAFPAYEAIIPKEKKIITKVNPNTLLQSLKIASLFSRDSAFSTKLHLKNKSLTITAISPQLGESKNEIALEQPVDEFEISANAQYLIDVLPNVGKDIELSFGDAKSPILISLPNSDDYLYLVMPLRSE
jgi:DNA polymerase-3 subunit beta